MRERGREGGREKERKEGRGLKYGHTSLMEHNYIELNKSAKSSISAEPLAILQSLKILKLVHRHTCILNPFRI